MNDRIRLSPIVIALIITNMIGILLKYFNLDNYLILFGFRFQLSMILPSLIMIKHMPKDFITDIFTKPKSKSKLFFIYLLIIPILILLSILFVVKQIELGDPEYFYEFGLSSVIDFPIYLIWNAPQLILFFLFLFFVESCFKFYAVFLIFVSLFAYGFIPANTVSPDYFQIISLILSASMLGMLIKYFQNIYWLIIFSFSILWLNIILFGSKSELFINLIFASQYNSWEGFLSVGKEFKSFLLQANLLLTNIILIFSIWRKRKLSTSF